MAIWLRFIGKINSLGDDNCIVNCKILKNKMGIKANIPSAPIHGKPRTHRTNPIFFNDFWNEKSERHMDKNSIMDALW